MKLKSRILAGALALSLLTTTLAADISDFSDVQTHWAKDTIEIMVDEGLMSGVSTASDGTATFNPDGELTIGEFWTIATRLVAEDYIEIGRFAQEYGDYQYHWAGDYYLAAIDAGLTGSSFSLWMDCSSMVGYESTFVHNMNSSLTREEMARYLCVLAEFNGETLEATENIGYAIADYNFINWTDQVEAVYSSGIIGGKDANGTFSPNDSLTRAEATVMFCRFMEYIPRLEVTFDVPEDENGDPIPFAAASDDEDENGAITIYEGALRTNRPAQAGDTLIKEDGTVVLLALDENGVLTGQGAADVGLSRGSGSVMVGLSWHSDITFYDSLGNSIQNQSYQLNGTTGDGYWTPTWQYLETIVERPSYNGSYDDEVSTDKYHLYRWSTALNWWMLNNVGTFEE